MTLLRDRLKTSSQQRVIVRWLCNLNVWAIVRLRIIVRSKVHDILTDLSTPLLICLTWLPIDLLAGITGWNTRVSALNLWDLSLL